MDSTLISIESVDKMLEYALEKKLSGVELENALKEIDDLMKKGMGGKSTLSETVPARFNLVAKLGVTITEKDFKEMEKVVYESVCSQLLSVLKNLQAEGFEFNVAVVSGGPKEFVETSAKKVEEEIGKKVTTRFNIVKSCATGFDYENSSLEDGKLKAVESISNDPAKLIMVGDGSTDLAVYENGKADYFIGAGWIDQRPVIFDKEDNVPHFQKCNDLSKLEDILKTILK